MLGAYGHGVFAALQTLAPAEAARFGGLRERLRIVRVKRVIIATGALERLVACPGNDVPGVMLAGAALAYLRRYGVAVGRRPAFFVNNDEAYEAVFALAAAGINCAGVIDARSESLAAERAGARRRGPWRRGRRGVIGRRRGSWSAIPVDGSTRVTLEADCLLMSGGTRPRRRSQTSSARHSVAGEDRSLHGGAGLKAWTRRGRGARCVRTRRRRLGRRTVRVRDRSGLGSQRRRRGLCWISSGRCSHALKPLWEVAAPGKAFVDLQNDVTAADVRLACREGYEHLEHMKRFTTFGMATDQGRIGGLVGARNPGALSRRAAVGSGPAPAAAVSHRFPCGARGRRSPRALQT